MMVDTTDGPKFDSILPGEAKTVEHDRVTTYIALDQTLQNENLETNVN